MSVDRHTSAVQDRDDAGMTNNIAAWRGRESIEDYLERQFQSIHERLVSMESSIQGLNVDVEELAQAIPQIASNLGTVHEELTAKEKSLEEEVAKEGADQETIAKLQGELAQVSEAKAKLDPIVAQVQGLLPPPAAPAGA